MIKNMKSATRLLSAFLAVGIIPFTVIAILSLYQSHSVCVNTIFLREPSSYIG